MAESRAQAFPHFLQEALRLLETEAPVHFAALRTAQAGLTVVIRVGAGEPVAIRLAESSPWRVPSAAGEVDLRVSEDDLDRLLLGDITIEEAVVADQLVVRGQLDHVLAFLDGLRAGLHGALRCPSMPSLYDRYFALGRENVGHEDEEPHHGQQATN